MSRPPLEVAGSFTGPAVTCLSASVRPKDWRLRRNAVSKRADRWWSLRGPDALTAAGYFGDLCRPHRDAWRSSVSMYGDVGFCGSQPAWRLDDRHAKPFLG